jgi:hypothetical protein
MLGKEPIFTIHAELRQSPAWAERRMANDA